MHRRGLELYLIETSFIRRFAYHAILRSLGSDPIRIEFDPANGLPRVNYGRRLGVFIGRRLNPVTIALYACRELRLEEATGPIYLPHLLQLTGFSYVKRAANWLISNEVRPNARVSYWEYNFPWPSYGLKPPWRCALAEAFGGLLLIYAGYEVEARRHLEAILTDYRRSGVSYINERVLFPLEYVSDDKILVLNGILHCLLILHHCGIILDDKALIHAFNVGYKSLKPHLREFDAGFFTYYDSLKNPADEKYHRIHVELLDRVYRCTGDRDLLPLITRWTRYTKCYAIAEPLALLQHFINRSIVKNSECSDVQTYLNSSAGCLR